jgi:hypothetical protein
VVEAVLAKAIPKHNNPFAPYFTVEKKTFWDKNDDPVVKPLFFCHLQLEFMQLVTQLRLQVGDQLKSWCRGAQDRCGSSWPSA